MCDLSLSVCHDKQMPPFSAVTLLHAPAVVNAKASYWSKIAIFALFTGSPISLNQNCAITSKMVQLYDGEKNFKDMIDDK